MLWRKIVKDGSSIAFQNMTEFRMVKSFTRRLMLVATDAIAKEKVIKTKEMSR